MTAPLPLAKAMSLTAVGRDETMKKIGIETGIHYRPIHKFSMYDNSTHLPITESVGNSIVTLPTHPNLSKSNIDLIINSVNKFGK